MADLEDRVSGEEKELQRELIEHAARPVFLGIFMNNLIEY